MKKLIAEGDDLVPTMYLLNYLICSISPSQNEHLTLSVLSLRALCLMNKHPERRVSVMDLLGVTVKGHDTVIFSYVPTDFNVLKLTQHHTRDNMHSLFGMRSHFVFMNAQQAASFDGIMLCNPCITTQDKASRTNMQQQAHNPGSKRLKLAQAQLDNEVEKCVIVDRKGVSSILLIVSDLSVDQNIIVPSGVALLHDASLKNFFGPLLASRRAMCFNEAPNSHSVQVHADAQSASHSTSQSRNQSVSQSMIQTTNQSTSRSASQQTVQSTSRKRSTYQAFSQSNNQSTNQSATATVPVHEYHLRARKHSKPS